MEPTDRINGADPTQPLFALRDPATGHIRAIRDMTNQELLRHKTIALKELAQQHSSMSEVLMPDEMPTTSEGFALLMPAVLAAIQAIANVKALIAVINYEAHRRSVSIVVPH